MKRTTPRSTRTDTLFPYTTPLRSHQVQERLACRQRGARARHGDGKIDFRIGGQHVACLRFGPASRGERLCNGFSRLPAHQCFAHEGIEFLCSCGHSGAPWFVRGTLAGGTNVHSRGLRRSEEHTSELQSLMRISYAVFCLKTTTHV